MRRDLLILLLPVCWSIPLLLPAMPAAEPHPDMQQLARESANTSELAECFAYFVHRAEEEICVEILQRFERVAGESFGHCRNPDEKQQLLDYTGWLVGEMTEALEQSKQGSATLQDLLEELARHYPRREDETP